MSRVVVILAVLAVAGMAVSAVSLVNHYADDDASSFCAVDETFNCDLVNKSIYARVFGVPVALVGLVGYGVLLALVFMPRAWPRRLLLAGALSGLGFSIYLTYVEAFVLGVYCILCLASLALILAISVLAALMLGRAPKPHAA